MNKTLIIAIIISLATPVFSESNRQQISKKTAQASVQSKKSADGIHKEVIIARAYKDREKKTPVYTEKHTAIYKNGKLQTSMNDYFDLEGKKIAELNSDYSRSLMMPTYLFRNFKTGTKEGLRWEGGRYLIFRQEKGGPEEYKPLDNAENVFSCQGWHYYLIANLNQLKKRPIKMKLIFPSRLDYYSFRIRPIESAEKMLTLRLEFDSWFIRLFAPHLDMIYDKNKKKIIEYYGPSNILDDKGEIQNVYILYD